MRAEGQRGIRGGSKRCARSPRWLALLPLVVGCAGAPQPVENAVRPETSGSVAGASAAVAAANLESPYLRALRDRLGADATLSLDAELQRAAAEALHGAGTPGAIVALDPNDGSVLAVDSVAGDRGDPLLVPQRPASTFKVFTALAALRAGAITPDTAFTCTGSYDFAQAHLTCPAAHGREDVRHALAVSCNAFFYQVGEQLEPARLAETAREFGLNSPAGSELDLRGGVVPGPPPAGAPKTPRALLDAIGHGDYEVTLLGLARAYAAIANGGNLNELHLVTSRRGADGKPVRVTHAPAAKLGFEPTLLALVREGLADNVAAPYGRTHAVAIPGYPFAGKSGSADAPPRAGALLDAAAPGDEQDLWFVAYAPPVAPKLLVAARLERAHDNLSAMRVVAQVLARTLSHEADHRR